MKKKWIAVVVILICCLVYAIAKFSMSDLQNDPEIQNVHKQPEETQSAGQINTDNIDKTKSAESTQQMNTDDTDEAAPEEDTGSTVPADQIEAVTKAYGELRNAIVNEDYEQAWMLLSEVVKSKNSFEEFKESVVGAGSEMAGAIVRPESTISIEGRVGLLLTAPSNEDSKSGIYFFFIEENGRWKFSGAENAEYVDTSKE